jgi:hypothetical protein
MQAALYDPANGYYRRARDPFGKQGDFYTAEQIQPVFGILMAARIRTLYHEMGAPRISPSSSWAPADARWPLRSPNGATFPVDLGVDPDGAMPERFRGVVFANEFFDALPVDEVTFRDGASASCASHGTGASCGWPGRPRARRSRIICAATFRRPSKARSSR